MKQQQKQRPRQKPVTSLKKCMKARRNRSLSVKAQIKFILGILGSFWGKSRTAQEEEGLCVLPSEDLPVGNLDCIVLVPSANKHSAERQV